MLYTREYIAKAIKGDYAFGTTVELNALENFLASLILTVMFPCAAIIWALAKIPLVSSLLKMFVMNYPRGAAGFFLRGAFYKAKLGYMGKNVLIDWGVLIWNPENLSVGDYSHIDTNVKVEATDYVKIGTNVHVASNSILQGRGGLTIEDYVGIAANVMIYSGMNHYTDGKTDKFYEASPCAPAETQHVLCAPVLLKRSAFVGVNTVIVPGVTVGEGGLIGACSFVNSDVPPYKIVAGIPAKPIKDRTRSSGDQK